MRRLAILADDLTGALDAAAPFASAQQPVTVSWSVPIATRSASFAIDGESREIPVAEATGRVVALLPAISARELAYKKIDSLIRRNTVAELKACSASGLFNSIVIAPAFPAQGCITRGGQQLARQSDGGWAPVGPNLAEAFHQEGRLIGLQDSLAGRGIAICDAESDADLAHLVASRAQLVEPVLWCGSAGLARALSGPTHAALRPAGRRRLVVVGSSHWVSAGQTRSLSEAYPGLPASIGSQRDIQPAMDAIGSAMERQGTAALDFAIPGHDPVHAAALYAGAFRELKVLPRPDILVAGGGETLYRLCAALEATRLDAIGEWMPGVAVSVLADGLWQGAHVVSKSGAFGAGDFLLNVLAEK